MAIGTCDNCGKKQTVIVRVCKHCNQNCCAHCNSKRKGGKCLNCGKVGMKPV